MKYIAHRGLSSQAPENSLAAFILAAQNEHYFGIECDVYTTKDQEFVIFHDTDLKRLAKTNLNIMDTNYEDLLEHSIKKGHGIKKYPNEKIPLLSEFLDICKDFNKTAVIELKKVHEIESLIKLVQLLDEYPTVDAIIISFDMNYLKFLRAITDRKLQFLTKKVNDHMIYDCRVNQIDFSIDKETVKPKLISKLIKKGFEVAVYTVNHRLLARQYEKLGISYITTDTTLKG